LGIDEKKKEVELRRGGPGGIQWLTGDGRAEIGAKRTNPSHPKARDEMISTMSEGARDFPRP